MVWRVEFGSNYAHYDVVAETVRDAIARGEHLFLEESATDAKNRVVRRILTDLLREQPVTSVELIEEVG